MKLIVLGLVLASTSAFAQLGNFDSNGPAIGCMDEHIKEGIEGVKLCLKAQSAFIDKKNPDKRMVTFHSILQAALNDIPKKGKAAGTSASALVAKLINDAKAAMKNSANAYSNELRHTVTMNASVAGLFTKCKTESRSERFLSNSCTNLAQKVSSVLEKKMVELEFGQNFNKKIYAEFEGISGDLQQAFAMHKRFEPLLKQLEAERFNMGYARDDASEGAVKAQAKFNVFVQKYDGVSYAHKADVLKELQDLGIAL